MTDVLIRLQQGGSELNIDSGGFLKVAGTLVFENGASFGIDSGASITVADGGAFKVGGITFRGGTEIPTYTASPGDVHFRSEGSVSLMYINRSDGVSGSVWHSGSELA